MVKVYLTAKTLPDFNTFLAFSKEVLGRHVSNLADLKSRQSELQRFALMLSEAIDCEMQFADDVLELGLAGLSKTDMLEFLKFCADQRLARLGIKYRFNGKNNFAFMDLQNYAEHTNFFERTVSSYQIGAVAAKEEDINIGNMDF